MSGPEPALDDEGDMRPLVAPPRSNRGPWLFGAGAVAAGLLLFQALEARRSAVTAPAITAPADGGSGALASPPELAIPAEGAPEWRQYPSWQQPPVVLRPVLPGYAPPPAPRVIRAAPPGGGFAGSVQAPPPPVAAGQTWLPPQSSQVPPPAAVFPRPGASDAAGSARGKERVEASRFANPATTVPKGTVVQAVLESALDSTRGGFARAIVSRDIYSFDGSRVLVPRGSRIIGEYKSDVSLGQRRILIQWQRLMRPDGVMIDLDSPSADTLGRAGVTGSVNTHFFERFAGAILQSTLDIGVQLATRAATRNDTVVLALPGSVSQATQALQPERIPPTVKVRQGTSVSVFVARDLDFTEVEQ